MRKSRPFSVFRSVPICVATGAVGLEGGDAPRAADPPAAGAGRAFHGSILPRAGGTPNNMQRSRCRVAQDNVRGLAVL